jgi:hypothetical protein
MLCERVRDGLERARREGKRLRRPSTAAVHAAEVRALRRRDQSHAEIARQLGIAEMSVRRILARSRRVRKAVRIEGLDRCSVSREAEIPLGPRLIRYGHLTQTVGADPQSPLERVFSPGQGAGPTCSPSSSRPRSLAGTGAALRDSGRTSLAARAARRSPRLQGRRSYLVDGDTERQRCLALWHTPRVGRNVVRVVAAESDRHGSWTSIPTRRPKHPFLRFPARRQARYADCGPTLAHEKLTQLRFVESARQPPLLPARRYRRACRSGHTGRVLQATAVRSD